MKRLPSLISISGVVAAVALLFATVFSARVQARSATRGKKSYGLCIISGTGRTTVNGDCFYPMYSVVKFPQAVYVADRLHRLGISLDSTVTVQRNRLMQDTWSPMLGEMGETAVFSFRELLRLSLVESDNNACDLLFRHCGMPESVDAYLKDLGFNDINVAVTESRMHEDPSLIVKNCCTPVEMARLLLWLNEHKDDTAELREVWELMAACQTGRDRIPAAVPEGCRVVHKTGTGPSTEGSLPPMNDAGIILFPDGRVQAVAVFVPEPESDSHLAIIIGSCIKK